MARRINRHHLFRLYEATGAPSCEAPPNPPCCRSAALSENDDIIRPHSERRSGAERAGGGEGGGVAWEISLPRRDWPGPAVMSHISKLLSRALNRQGCLAEDEADGQKVASSEIKKKGEEKNESEREREGEREKEREGERG